MMIHRLNYFSGLALLLVSVVFFTCGTTKATLSFRKSYESVASNGEPTRAFIYYEPFIVTGGAKGMFSVHNIDTLKMPLPMVDQIEGVEDIRDAHFVSEGSCLFMNSGTRGIVVGVLRNGKKLMVYDTAGVFMDGMTFWEDQQGIIYGDPVNGSFFLAKTFDNGNSWQAITPNSMPTALDGEAGFAASGTGIQTIGDSAVYFVTGGGETARLFCSYDRGMNWTAKETPVKSGDSYGLYSMFFMDEMEGFVIGGSYKDSTFKKNICQYTTDGGNTWINRSKGLPGYCSCIQGRKDGKLIVATGRVGTYYSLDKGKKWNVLTNLPFYTCYVADKKIVLSGKNGRLVVFDYTIEDKKA